MSIETGIILPGGILIDGILRKDAVFGSISGHTEILISNIVASKKSIPEKVTAILIETLSKIGGKKPTADLMDALSVADRQYLMINLAIDMEGSLVWLHLTCSECASLFDVKIDRKQLPVTNAGETYPFVNTELYQHKIRMKVPTGKVQSKLAECNEKEAIEILLRSCIDCVDNQIPNDEFYTRLTENDLLELESVFDTASPHVCNEIITRCPECDSQQLITLNPYSVASYSAGDLYKEIHTLASHYHWGEAEILSLPRERRHLYLRYIDSGQGMHM